MKYYVNFFVHDSSLNDDFSDRKMIANHFLAIAILFFRDPIAIAIPNPKKLRLAI